MSGRDEDYRALKGFLGYFVDRHMLADTAIRPEDHRLAVLASIEAAAPARARQGLRMTINDCLEMSASFTPAEVKAADADLQRAGLPTLSALRLRFWKRTRGILKRGKIGTEVQHHAIRNAAEVSQAEADRARLVALVAEFEARGLPGRPPTR